MLTKIFFWIERSSTMGCIYQSFTVFKKILLGFKSCFLYIFRKRKISIEVQNSLLKNLNYYLLYMRNIIIIELDNLLSFEKLDRCSPEPWSLPGLSDFASLIKTVNSNLF